MIKDIIRYIIIILIVVAIVLVMKNLVSSDSNWQNDDKSKDKTEEVYYSAKISLKDQETEEFISGATLVVKDETGETIDSWTTSNEIHTVSKLKKGTYTLSQIKASEDYKLNEEPITFKIENNNVNVTMNNEKKTEAELQQEKVQNTISDEINVDNTLSTKNKFITLLSILTILGGISIVSYQTTKRISYSNK